MKNQKRMLTIMIAAATLLALVITYAMAESLTRQATTPSGQTEPSLSRVTFAVTNMSCGGCEYTIKESLKPFDGINAVQVDLVEDKVNVLFDPKKITDVNRLAEAITDSGYPATVLQVVAADRLSPQRRANYGGCGGGCGSYRR